MNYIGITVNRHPLGGQPQQLILNQPRRSSLNRYIMSVQCQCRMIRCGVPVIDLGTQIQSRCQRNPALMAKGQAIIKVIDQSNWPIHRQSSNRWLNKNKIYCNSRLYDLQKCSVEQQNRKVLQELILKYGEEDRFKEWIITYFRCETSGKTSISSVFSLSLFFLVMTIKPCFNHKIHVWNRLR